MGKVNEGEAPRELRPLSHGSVRYVPGSWEDVEEPHLPDKYTIHTLLLYQVVVIVSHEAPSV